MRPDRIAMAIWLVSPFKLVVASGSTDIPEPEQLESHTQSTHCSPSYSSLESIAVRDEYLPTCDIVVVPESEEAEYDLEPHYATREQILDEVVSIDRSNFPSFEEWRKLNLEKSGQSEQNFDERHRKVVADKIHQEDFKQGDGTVQQGTGQGVGGLGAEGESNLFTDPSEGRVYKERFNYASFDCAATIMKTNTDTKGAANILSENKDTYMLNKCESNNKFVVIELCNDILVDTVSIANYEFFSSMFKHIRISVADRFPVPSSTGWHVLGEFGAMGIRDIQHFRIGSPKIWARYLQIEFLSHWGHEYYCPVSLVRVHGTTMMDEYRSQEQTGGGDASTNDNLNPIDSTEQEKEGDDALTASYHVAELDPTASSEGTTIIADSLTAADVPGPTSSSLTYQSPINEHDHHQIHDELAAYNSSVLSDVSLNTIISPLVLNESCCWEEYVSKAGLNISSNSSHAFNRLNNSISVNSNSIQDENSTISGYNGTNITTNSTGSVNATVPIAEPKTQDSIYQTIMKRLSLLESNATLSLKYIEEQSQNLRDVLFKIEKKQNLRIELFFSQFNNSVIEQLNFFQQQYSNLLMETVVDLERHRAKSEQDVLALSSRLSLLADEMMYQKRLGVIQATILFAILVFVVTTRGSSGSATGESWSGGASPVYNRISEGISRGWQQVSSPSAPGSPGSSVLVPVPGAYSRNFFPEQVDPSVAFMHSDSELSPVEESGEAQVVVDKPHMRSRSMPSLEVEIEGSSDIVDEEEEDEEEGDDDDEEYFHKGDVLGGPDNIDSDFDTYETIETAPSNVPYPSPSPGLDNN